MNGQLKSASVFWEESDPEITAALKLAPEDLPKLTLIRLIKQLDRRHMQLQDKVAFEREHGLVDYSKLEKSNGSI